MIWTIALVKNGQYSVEAISIVQTPMFASLSCLLLWNVFPRVIKLNLSECLICFGDCIFLQTEVNDLIWDCQLLKLYNAFLLHTHIQSHLLGMILLKYVNKYSHNWTDVISTSTILHSKFRFIYTLASLSPLFQNHTLHIHLGEK